VKRVAKYLSLWRLNTAAIGALDPSKSLEINEMFAAMDALMKKGEIKEFGFFPDATSGYLIGEGEVTDIFRAANMFLPFILGETHQVIPYEKGKEILLALLKAQVAPAKK
jgi:hypothetical protein